MKQILLISAASLLGTAVAAQELGTVISSTPVMQQVAVPRLVCQDQQVVAAAQPSGAGAVIGAIAGGVIGSALGGGSGHAAATALGAVGGAVLGNQAEANQPVQTRTVQNCSTQTFYQTQPAYYDVVYEYAGRRYRVQLAHDPGPTLPLQVSPVGSLPPVQAPLQPIQAPAYVPPAPPVTVYRDEPVYSAPSYVAPLAIGLTLGYIGGHLSRPRYYGPPPRAYRPPPPPPGWRHRY
ncbi:glycine zipper 2TM domain-containing protein [Pseudorhodoferax sp.]|uniref:glycine zipper 2TM domain-containing protein n=1 Tax=Pseudorhodoferax sp. TaxID=1993553 RepID=UPI0039E409CC